MSPTLAGAIGGALMMLAGILAMATMSHCPRRWRVWPAALVGLGALYGSDRLLQVLIDASYLHDVRGWVIVAAMGAALGTISVLCVMISDMCPLCQPRKRAHAADASGRGLPA